MVWTRVWGCAWVLLGRRGPTQFCCSLSRVAVSPGPLSGPAEGGDGCDLEVWWGLKAPGTVLTDDGDVCERGAWLLGRGVACGRDWLGLRPGQEVVDVAVGAAACGREVRQLAGGFLDVWRPTGGVASGSGFLVPGGVTGGREMDVSRRVWLPSGDWGMLSSLEARRPFW